MEPKEMVFHVRKRVAELEGLRADADAELRKLKDLPCPNPGCQNGYIFQEVPNEGGEGYFPSQTTCTVCDGTGKAVGRKT